MAGAAACLHLPLTSPCSAMLPHASHFAPHAAHPPCLPTCCNVRSASHLPTCSSTPLASYAPASRNAPPASHLPLIPHVPRCISCLSPFPTLPTLHPLSLTSSRAPARPLPLTPLRATTHPMPLTSPHAAFHTLARLSPAHMLQHAPGQAAPEQQLLRAGAQQVAHERQGRRRRLTHLHRQSNRRRAQ